MRRACDYLTRIVLTADLLDVPLYVTRTRSLYLPVADGARHFRLYVPADVRFCDAPFLQDEAVAFLYCSVALTACAGVRASRPVTVTVLPCLTLVGALIESVVLWQSVDVALVFGAVTPATAMTAAAIATMTTVSARSGFLMILLARPADRAAVQTAT